MRKALKAGAATRPVGTVETYSYTGKSGVLSEQFSKMGMEQHINLMIASGWEVVNHVGLPGHVRLGRTLTGAALTGGLSLLAGGNRTSDRVTITYRRVQVPPAPAAGDLIALRRGADKKTISQVIVVVGSLVGAGFLLLFITWWTVMLISDDRAPSPAVVPVSATPSATPAQTNRPNVPPPKFQIYKFKDDGISPTIVVVPVRTTDEQLKSLLWLFREKVRSHKFKDIGLKNERDGILAVYRGKKCANEEYVMAQALVVRATMMTPSTNGEFRVTHTRIQEAFV